MSETNEQTSIFDTLRGLVASSEKKETVKAKTNPKTKTRKKKQEVVVVEELPPKDITALPTTGKKEYCPKGTRKNRKTGKCEPYEKKKEVPADIPVVEGEKEEPEPEPEPVIEETSDPEPVIEETSEPEPVVEEKKKRKACPKGTRKNRKTGKCEPYEKKKEVPADIPVVKEETPEPEPEPVIEETSEPEPEPVIEETSEPEPEPVIEETSEPEPVIEETSEPEPEPVIEETSEPEPEPVVEEKKKRKACPKGMRKNRKTGECEPYEKKKEVPSDIPVVNEEKEEKEDPDVNEASEPEPEPVVEEKKKRKVCPKGTRKNRKTGECEPYEKKKKEVVEEVPQETSTMDLGLSSITSMLFGSTEVKKEPVEDKKETTTTTKEPAENNKEETTPDPHAETRKRFRRKKRSGPAIPLVNPEGADLTPEMQEEIDEFEGSVKADEPEPESEQDEPESEQDEPEPEQDEPESEQDEPEQDDDESIDSVPSTDQNTQSFQQEKEEFEDYKTNPTDEYDFLYPDQNDPNFNIKIAKHKIFQDTKYDGTIHDDIEKQADKECNLDFEIMPHQQFVRNFMSLDTPYNSLLLYHELGTGKTCSAIGITEEMRHYMKQTGNRAKIIIIASPNVRQNFRSQLFDDSKLEKVGKQTGAWSLNTCVGNSLIKEVTHTQNQPLRREQVQRRIDAIIRENYVFMGYEEFGIVMNNVGDVEPILDTDSQETKDKKQERINMIRREFDNSLIVIDEVHNVIGENKKDKRRSTMIVRLTKLCENLRFLFLTATPMYNSHKEIVWLTNLMNLNDNRPTMSTNQVFQDNGAFVEERKDNNGNLIQESGEDLLKRKLIGYVSYVRGENPYAFPFRVYPALFAEPDHVLAQKTYPTLQMNEKNIPEGIEFLDVYVSTMSPYQQKVYNLFIEKQKEKSAFMNMERFGYTWLSTPLSLLNMVYPTEDVDAYVEKDEPMDPGMMAECHGAEGLNSVVSYEETAGAEGTGIPLLSEFEYKPEVLEKHGRIFELEKIGSFSAKIAQICKCIQQSTGIVLIYSKFIQAGLIPMALALEEMGFTRAGKANTYFKEDLRKPPLDALTMKPKTETGSHTAKYVMITGQKKVSPDNKYDLKLVTSSSNFDGKNVKVVLISEAGSEGLDFKNIRQVHVLDPWYNMNRIEQTIGRAVRTRSHCKLPFEQRNVEIYMHATYLDDKVESADMYMYRLAEKKAKMIGKVTRLLKETAVDCLLNIEQQNFSQEKLNKTISLTLSTNQKKIDYQVGDKPYSKNCDYLEKCEYACSPSLDAPIEPDQLTKETYNVTYLKSNHDRISKRIRQLYRTNVQYTMEELLKEIQILKPYPLEQVYYSLSLFLRNKNEWVVDKHGRKGYLILKDDVYAFQPMSITDTESSIYERSVPVDIKPKKVQVALPDAYQVPVVPTTQEVVSMKLARHEDDEGDDDNEKSVVEHSVVEHPADDDGANISSVISDIQQKLKMILRTDFNRTTSKEWYTNANLGYLILLHVHKVPEVRLRSYFYFHIMDTLLFSQKLELVRHFFKTQSDFENQLDYDDDFGKDVDDMDHTSIIKHYLLWRMNTDHVAEDKAYIYLTNETKNEMYTWKDGVWNPSTTTEKENPQNVKWIHRNFDLQDPLLKRANAQTNTDDLDIGFIGLYKKKETDGYGFKTKNVLQLKNNLGAKCSDADKQKVLTKLNRFLGMMGRKDEEYMKEPVYYVEQQEIRAKDNLKKISKKAAAKLKIEPVERVHLCVIYEMLMRHEGALSVFFSPEQAIESAVTSLAIASKSQGDNVEFYYKKA